MDFDLAFLVGVSTNLAIVALLRTVRRARHSGAFHLVSFFACLCCVGLMATTGFSRSRSAEFRFGATGIRDLIGFFWMWFAWGATLLPILVFLVWDHADDFKGWCLGERQKAKRSYDQVEAALLMRDKDRAERLVREMIEGDEKDAELRLVLGDVLLRKGDRAGADEAFRASIARAHDAEERAGLRLRMADHLAERGHDPAAALAELQKVLDELPRSRLAALALARIASLRPAAKRR